MAVNETKTVKREEGHKLLARLGKTRLRPGGKEATEWLLEHADFSEDSNVLEVACNMGTTLIDVKKKYGCEITGLDKDKEALKNAEDNIEKEGLAGKINLVNGDATELPFGDEEFNTVINEAMLTMLSQKQKEAAVREYHRVLKDGGVLLTHDVCLTEEDPEVVAKLKKAINVPAEPLTEENWRKLFEDAGFKDVEIKTGKMTLMSPEGMIKDEGMERVMEIMEKAQNDPNFGQFLEMKDFFDENREKLLYIAVISKK